MYRAVANGTATTTAHPFPKYGLKVTPVHHLVVRLGCIPMKAYFVVIRKARCGYGGVKKPEAREHTEQRERHELCVEQFRQYVMAFTLKYGFPLQL